MKVIKHRYLVIFVIVIYASFLLYYYPLLPETVASHFTLSGEPVGWMNKKWFLIFIITVFFFLSAVFLFIFRFMKKSPGKIINIPNKEYHLSGERKLKTINILSNFLAVIFILTTAFLTAVNYMVFRFNLGYNDKLSSSFDVVLVVYIFFIIIMSVKMYKKFRKVPEMHRRN